MAKILVPTALRSFTDRQAEISLPGNTVQALLQALTDQYPDLRAHLYGDDGTLRPFINVFVGEENIKNKNGLQTPVADGESVLLIPAIAGGK
jgi:molybdopterin converting factor small subunit